MLQPCCDVEPHSTAVRTRIEAGSIRFEPPGTCNSLNPAVMSNPVRTLFEPVRTSREVPLLQPCCDAEPGSNPIQSRFEPVRNSWEVQLLQPCCDVEPGSNPVHSRFEPVRTSREVQLLQPCCDFEPERSDGDLGLYNIKSSKSPLPPPLAPLPDP